MRNCNNLYEVITSLYLSGRLQSGTRFPLCLAQGNEDNSIRLTFWRSRGLLFKLSGFAVNNVEIAQISCFDVVSSRDNRSAIKLLSNSVRDPDDLRDCPFGLV